MNFYSIRNRILYYLIAPSMVVVALFIVGFIYVAEKNFNGYVENNAEADSKRIVANIKDRFIDKNFSKLNEQIFDEKFSGFRILYIEVLSDQGQPMASTFLNQPPVRLPPINGKAATAVKSNLVYYGSPILNIDSPVFIGIYRVGTVRVGYDLRDVQAAIRQTAYVSLAVFVIFLLVGIHLSVILSGRIIRSIENLAEAAKKYSDGEVLVSQELISNDEVGQLALAFNRMTEKISAAKRELESERDQLKDKVAELENWQNATINRELKMVELKKEINDLKETLAKKSS